METERIEEHEDEGALVVDSTMLGAITGAEIDRQIATAKRYPRSLTRFKKEVQEMACLDEATAEECIYALPRKDKSGQTKNIEGPSARFAEIVVSAWGNARAGARVIAEEKDFVVAQGMFHDLERNVAIQFEVKRRISDKFGRRFGADMIAVTGNAAASIALRNAVFKGVPKAYWAPAWEQAKTVAMGKAETLANRRGKLLDYFHKMGVTAEQVVAAVGRKGVEDITLDDIATLKGIATAIKEGDTTIEAAFPDPKHQAAPATPAAAPKAPDAPPPQAKVQESAGYGSAEPEPAPAKKQRKAKAEEPAAAAPPPAKAAEPAAPTHDAEAEQHEQEAAAQAEAEQAGPKEGQSALPILDDTVLILPFEGGASVEPDRKGTICYQGEKRDPAFLQWTDKGWLEFVDQGAAYDWAHKAMQRKITQHCKRARMERAQALAWARETLRLATAVEQFAQLSLDQLVELARSLDSPAK